MPNLRCNSCGHLLKQEETMRLCQYCSRPANKKVVRRDDYGRVHDVFVCEKHEKEAQKEKPNA